MTGTTNLQPVRPEVSWHVIFDALEEPVLVIDREERVIDVNRAALRELHCSADRARRLSLAELHGEPWRGCRALAKVVKMMGTERERDLRDSGSGRHWSIRCRYLDGARPIGVADVVREGAGECDDRLLLLVLRETTDFHLLRDAMRQFEKSTWLADVVGDLAHQVNNPLFAISSTVDWLLQHANDKAETEIVAVLQREVGRLSRLMRAFVEFSTISCRHRGRHKLEALVREACSACGLVEADAGPRLELQVESDVVALVDRDAIVLALSKVLENARDLSPENGTIWITGRRTPTESNGENGASAGFELRIRDQGPGIPAAFRRRIFEPFFSRRSGHHGLGLALAERILVAHGGTIAHEEWHQGSCLVLWLPAIAQRCDDEDSI